ncbi:3-deoxy-D-manno-octulosonic acid transferase [Iodidimonas gelatinilytica]|uniref:3-deoxy-D-manno-octulosonic acid transferase n=1 Tax=Iodidimonas gelatinilytica TaxID=1236966 RepID=A0A5A7MTT5_9PROT|nr:DUF3800 domain-containing protein [Iodidimonas gelatinilytica]GEQ99330.1 3-deoxy-D-manno-octulosonic acid transferase [Iodidimonas gelatinilytica]
MPDFSDYIVYADESGDHGMVNIDPQYPMFALTFCVMRKDAYTAEIVPAMQGFKFGIWGHDTVVLHEHEIRKSLGPFGLLRTDRALRTRFMKELNALIETAPMTIFASVIHKEKHRERYANPWNPYEIALHFCMERLHMMLAEEDQHGKTVHVVFESRGAKEDAELEREFRRIAGNDNHWGYWRHDFSRFDFQPVFIPKAANASGLQLADLTARPIALSQLRPGQPNRAFDIIRPKLRDLKCFP